MQVRAEVFLTQKGVGGFLCQLKQTVSAAKD